MKIFFKNLWLIIEEMGNNGTLPILTTLLTVIMTAIIAIVTGTIAYKNYKSGEWKARLELEFVYSQNEELNRILQPSILKYGYTNVSVKSVEYYPESTEFDPRWRQGGFNSFAVAYNAVLLARLKVRNIGRGELRFERPFFNSRYETLPLIFIEARKNNIEVDNASEKMYFELKSGEVIDFYYDIKEIVDVSSRSFGLLLALNKIFRLPRLFQVAVKDNRGKKVVLPFWRSWRFYENQYRLETKKVQKSIARNNLADNIILQGLFRVICKEALIKKTPVSIHTLWTLAYHLVSPLKESEVFLISDSSDIRISVNTSDETYNRIQSVIDLVLYCYFEDMSDKLSYVKNITDDKLRKEFVTR